MSHEQRINKEHGIFIRNIIQFPRHELNVVVKKALYHLINTTCSLFGTYGLVFSPENPHINTTTAFLRFDDDEFNPIAAEIIDQQPLKIDACTYRLQIIAYLNPKKPSPAAEEHHQHHRKIRLAGTKSIKTEAQPQTSTTTTTTISSSSSQSTSTTTNSNHQTRSSSVRRLRHSSRDPRQNENRRTASQAPTPPQTQANTQPPPPPTLFSLHNPAIATIRRARVDSTLLLDETMLCSDCMAPTTVRQLPEHRRSCAKYITRTLTTKTA